MLYLLDTATLLSIAADSKKLSPYALSVLEDRSNSLFISVVSLWEIQVKIRIGKLQYAQPIDRLLASLLEAHAATLLPLRPEATYRLPGLPSIHRDPFDLMLICHALDAGMTILTPDELIQKYPVPTAW